MAHAIITICFVNSILGAETTNHFGQIVKYIWLYGTACTSTRSNFHYFDNRLPRPLARYILTPYAKSNCIFQNLKNFVNTRTRTNFRRIFRKVDKTVEKYRFIHKVLLSTFYRFIQFYSLVSNVKKWMWIKRYFKKMWIKRDLPIFVSHLPMLVWHFHYRII